MGSFIKGFRLWGVKRFPGCWHRAEQWQVSEKVIERLDRDLIQVGTCQLVVVLTVRPVFPRKPTLRPIQSRNRVYGLVEPVGRFCMDWINSNATDKTRSLKGEVSMSEWR